MSAMFHDAAMTAAQFDRGRLREKQRRAQMVPSKSCHCCSSTSPARGVKTRSVVDQRVQLPDFLMTYEPVSATRSGRADRPETRRRFSGAVYQLVRKSQSLLRGTVVMHGELCARRMQAAADRRTHALLRPRSPHHFALHPLLH